MRYKKIKEAIFLSRPNRFIANVMIDGKKETVHVKNTGRCKELLLEGVKVYLEDHGEDQRARKTRYSLIAVEKKILAGEEERNLLINIDSYAPNRAVGEALAEGRIILPGLSSRLSLIKAEATYQASRFDFYVEDENGVKAFLEVKGVTLEDQGIVRFPDAPTERGVKHVKELCEALENDYKAFIIFVIQMKGLLYFEPNDETHPAFGDALRQASDRHVEILAFDCDVTKESMKLGEKVEVRL